MADAVFRILKVDSSAGGSGSKTRAATTALAERLAKSSDREAVIDHVDLVAAPPPLLADAMVASYFTGTGQPDR